MVRLYFRHEATGITIEVGEQSTKKVEVDMRDGTMALIDKVAVEKGMSVIEAMSNSQVTIFAEWVAET